MVKKFLLQELTILFFLVPAVNSEKLGEKKQQFYNSEKFDSIRISVLRDITKILKKFNYVKNVKNIYFA